MQQMQQLHIYNHSNTYTSEYKYMYVNTDKVQVTSV